MKKYSLLLLAFFYISSASAFGQASTQEKTKTEAEKEALIQQAINEQKKAMTEQRKLQTETRGALIDQNAPVLDTTRSRVNSGRGENDPRSMNPRGIRQFSNGDSFSFTYPGSDPFFSRFAGNDTERTTWDFSKSLKENSFSRDYTFDVDKSVKNFVMAVIGDCKAGEIKIKILMPNGKIYSDILIDELGNLNSRKTFAISETENQDKVGAWKFQISSSKATGFFKISLQTF
jgi:hypothetical protein